MTDETREVITSADVAQISASDLVGTDPRRKPNMTRAEAEAHLRLIKRTCRGPLALSDEDRAKYGVGVETKSYEELVKLKEELEKKLGQSAWATPDRESAFNRVHSLIHWHVGCGQDVNEMILAQPLDGKFHEANCPKCGVHQHWTPANYEASV